MTVAWTEAPTTAWLWLSVTNRRTLRLTWTETQSAPCWPRPGGSVTPLRTLWRATPACRVHATNPCSRSSSEKETSDANNVFPSLTNGFWRAVHEFVKKKSYYWLYLWSKELPPCLHLHHFILHRISSERLIISCKVTGTRRRVSATWRNKKMS